MKGGGGMAADECNEQIDTLEKDEWTDFKVKRGGGRVVVLARESDRMMVG